MQGGNEVLARITSVRLTPEHKERLKKLADLIGYDQSAVVRQLIDNAVVEQAENEFRLSAKLPIAKDHERRKIGTTRATVATRVPAVYAERMKQIAKERGMLPGNVARAIICAYFEAEENSVAGHGANEAGHAAGTL